VQAVIAVKTEANVRARWCPPFPGGGMRGRALILAGIALLGLVLGGCLHPPAPAPGPELVVVYGEPRTLVHFEVVGAEATKYIWDFGDGNTQETTTPKVFHHYASADVYLVKVEGYRRGATGSGAPGPGMPGGEVLLFHLEATVDTRPAVEIAGIEIKPIDPPYWYRPGSPAWPEDHFPANVALRFKAQIKTNRPQELSVESMVWYVYDSWNRLLKSANELEWIWHEASQDFRVYGCPGGATEYRVVLVLALSDGSVVRMEKSIWACPPGGCG